MADLTLNTVSEEVLAGLRESVRVEEERRALIGRSEREAARLAVEYVQAGGIFDALIASMCDAVEQAATEQQEREAREQLVLANIP
ncbi:MAG: hypothetical protein E6132_06020 [Actinomyces sp.]|nr:hypothetical protein [Actinomycetaceae bacterium]MDU5379586.1 hypothetical protein [Actinomyces sp.]